MAAERNGNAAIPTCWAEYVSAEVRLDFVQPSVP